MRLQTAHFQWPLAVHQNLLRMFIEAGITNGFEYLSALLVGICTIQHESRIPEDAVHETILLDEFLFGFLVRIGIAGRGSR